MALKNKLLRGNNMTEQQRKDAIESIEGQLECGYIDFGTYDKY